jgi:4-amino-4-deoxy-L-arabinose transferase-like glycosyltransferase
VSRHALILLVAAGLTFFLGLGRGAIGDSDEAFYAEAAREMVESGNWLTPFYNYELRFQKPILYYWLAAGAYKLTGVSEAAARVPAAASGLGLVFMTWLCARRWYSQRAALLAGLVAATSFGYFTMARMALPDLPLALCISVSCWALIESGWTAREGRDHQTFWWLLAASAAAALGMLVKGPVAIALPALVVLPVLVCPWTQRTWPWKPAHLLAAIALFGAIAMPWYVAMAREHGIGYLHHFFVGENLDRFATDRYNEPRPFWFYFPIILGGLLPWSAYMAPWVKSATRIVTRARPVATHEWHLFVWAAAPLAFYSCSIGKQPRYVLPMLPPLAILLAASLERRLERADAGDAGSRRSLAWCTTAAASVLLVFGALLHRGKPLLFAMEPTTGVIATALIIAAGLGLLVLGWTPWPRWIPLGVATASAAALLAVHFSIYSAEGIEPVQKMAASFERHWPGAQASGTYRVFVRNLVFYTGVKQTDLNSRDELREFLGRPGRVLAVATEEDLASIDSEHGLRPRRLEQVTYFNASGLRLRTLLHPDPSQDLETVWLVTNK